MYIKIVAKLAISASFDVSKVESAKVQFIILEITITAHV